MKNVHSKQSKGSKKIVHLRKVHFCYNTCPYSFLMLQTLLCIAYGN